MIFVLCFFTSILPLVVEPGLIARFASEVSLKSAAAVEDRSADEQLTILSLVLCSAALPMNYASWCSING